MKSKYQHYDSFYGKTLVVLSLIAIIPLLLVINTFVYEGIHVSDRMIMFCALAFFSILIGYTVLRRAADKLVWLTMEIGRIKNGESLEFLDIRAEREVNEIAGHFNEVLKKLKDENLEIKKQSVQLMIYARDLTQSYKKNKEEEALRNRLRRYVGENLIEKIMNDKDGVFFENERQDVTVFFADIRSFTSIAEQLDAEGVMAMLNEYFEVMVDIVFHNNGVLDKFVGDQIMAVFGLLDSPESAPTSAVRAAIEMQEATGRLMEQWREAGRCTFTIGIGINSGTAIVGNVGSSKRMDFTVIGDCVNMASRFEKEAAGGDIVVGEQIFLQCRHTYPFTLRGSVNIRIKTNPITCYTVIR